METLFEQQKSYIHTSDLDIIIIKKPKKISLPIFITSILSNNVVNICII